MRRCVPTYLACGMFILTQVLTLQGQCDREIMVQDYQQSMMATNVTTAELGWNGDIEHCQPGTVSELAIQRTMERINYFRSLAGVHSKLKYDTSLEAMCQAAALMMHSHNDLSHDPPDSWSCYSKEGKQAAGRSNLALGAHSVNAVSLYMRDPGTNNYAVGHRRWILYSRGKDIGLGSTSRAQVMYVIHNKTAAPENLKHITYPGEGYFPAPLVPDRWSFGYPKANFSTTEIRMENQDGDDIPLEILELKRGFGDNTIVWEPSSDMIDKYSEIDQTYSVSLFNVITEEDTIDVHYNVTIAPTTYPPICAEGLNWDESNCSCSNLQTTNIRALDKTSPVKVFPNPARTFVTFEVPHQYLSHQHPAIIQMSNTGGKRIKEILIEQSRTHLDISDLNDGIYFCRFVNGQYSSTQVLVKGQ